MKRNMFPLLLFLLLLPCVGLRAQEDITLRISWWGGQSRHQAVLSVINAYEQAHPNVTVEPEYGQFAPYYQKLITQLRSDSTADIFAIDYKWANQLLASREAFINIDTLTQQLSFTEAQRRFAGIYGGGDDFLIGVPMGVNVHSFVYNASLLAGFGLSPDSLDTWDALLEAGARVHAEDSDRYLLFLTSDAFTYLVRTLVKQRAGCCLLADDGTPGCTQEELADVFSYIVQLIDTHTLPPYEQCVLYENLSASTNPLWLEGRVGLFPIWTSAYPGLKAMDTPFEIGCMRYPCADDALNSGVMVTPTLFFAISSSSAHPAEAADLLSYLLAQTYDGSARNAFGAPLSLLAGEPSFMPDNVAEIIRQSMAAGGLPENGPSLSNEVNTLLKEELHRIGYKQETPEEAAARFFLELSTLR